MPRPSIQHIKRKHRLSGKDLTLLIKKDFPNADVKYNFGNKQHKIGWYAHYTPQINHFIGSNWIAARNHIKQQTLFALEGLI